MYRMTLLGDEAHGCFKLSYTERVLLIYHIQNVFFVSIIYRTCSSHLSYIERVLLIYHIQKMTRMYTIHIYIDIYVYVYIYIIYPSSQLSYTERVLLIYHIQNLTRMYTHIKYMSSILLPPSTIYRTCSSHLSYTEYIE